MIEQSIFSSRLAFKLSTQYQTKTKKQKIMNFPTTFCLVWAVFNMFLTQVLLLETPTKLLVVNGWSNNQKVPNPQVLNVANPSESCELPEFPADLIWSVGGYTDEGAIICSGRHPHTWVETNECYLLDNNIGEFVKTSSSLTLKRSLAGSVVTDNGKLWILGGYNGAIPPEQQTELYGTIQMADYLDVPLYGLCVAKINETTAIGT